MEKDSIVGQIEKAALLHGLGKIALRAGRLSGDYAFAGYDFFKQYGLSDDVLDAIRYHNDATGGGMSALIGKANNIAIGTDSRKIEGADKGFDSKRCLSSIFNIFRCADNSADVVANTSFNTCVLGNKMHFPNDEKKMEATPEHYVAILDELKALFDKKSPDKMSTNELLNVLENTISFVPESINTDELGDISLYDHSKMTAAFAVCLYKYLESGLAESYNDIDEKEDAFLLVSGDISGVQQFIYTIPSAGALKSLRGRSFYLDIMLENLVDEILFQCDIGRECLLYNGGGHFYMLMPNTTEVKKIISDFETNVNNWFLQHYGTRLYLAVGYTSCSAYEFSAKSEYGSGEVYRRVSRSLSEKKLRRYGDNQLMELFNPNSTYNNITGDKSRECGICHISTHKLEQYHHDDRAMACPNCRNLFTLGERILDGDVFRVSEEKTSTAVSLPGVDGNCLYLDAVSESAIRTSSVNVKRVYIKNKLYANSEKEIRVWLGDYVTKGKYTEKDKDGTEKSKEGVLPFEALAKISGGRFSKKGISRLGVLRADVDNLGAAFMSGFDRKYSTLSRTATLSRQLSMFFKRYINIMCSGELNGYGESGHEKFSMFPVKKEQKRNVHIIYSGGDDLFIVGAWDDLIELSVDIRNAFRRFTNNKLTFSAGVGLFQDKFPIAQMARKAGILEDTAKDHAVSKNGKILRTKDSIALFGSHSEIYQEYGKSKGADAYFWDVFQRSVCGMNPDAEDDELGKLQYMLKYMLLGAESADWKEKRLPVGKSALYSMMELLEETRQSDNINIARFSYKLARMEPQKGEKSSSYDSYKNIRKMLYNWYVNSKDKRELYTAITLAVYSLRNKEGKS